MIEFFKKNLRWDLLIENFKEIIYILQELFNFQIGKIWVSLLYTNNPIHDAIRFVGLSLFFYTNSFLNDLNVRLFWSCLLWDSYYFYYITKATISNMILAEIYAILDLI